MASKIDICNIALSRIGQGTIGNLTENSVQATVVNRVYEIALKEVLRGNNWSFAQVVENLALVSGYTNPNWTYAYQYPSSCLVFWKVSATTSSKHEGERFQEVYSPVLNQKLICTNIQYATGEYTFYVQDPSIYDSSFVNVLAYRLAADMAMPLNADPEIAKSMAALYQTTMSDAQRISSYEQDPTYIREVNPYVNARGSSGIQATQPFGGPGGTTFVQWNNAT